MLASKCNLLAASMFCAAALSSAALQAAPETRYTPNSRFTQRLPANPDPASVEILESPSPRAQVTIGKLAIRGDSRSPREELVQIARLKAAEMGADFIRVAGADESTVRMGGPAGAVRFGRTVPVLWVDLGVFAKATLGVEYMDFGVTWGRHVVKGFRPTSKAASAGVEIGDEIVEIDGIRTFGGEDRYSRWIISSVPDQVASLLLKRGDSTLTVQVPLVAND
jgi:hypothetical protein